MTSLAFVRGKVRSTVFLDQGADGVRLDRPTLAQMKISDRASSSSKNIIRGLLDQGTIHSAKEWKFWSGPLHQIDDVALLPVKLFPCEETLTSNVLVDHIQQQGQPDILWVEDRQAPPYLQQIFENCPDSFKIVYGKHWHPWKIEMLDQYDLCLVDEADQAEEIQRRFPNVPCGVWDKLIDAEHTHHPLSVEKKYDICYNAYLRPRKEHDVLFRAMYALKDRQLNCVCIGGDRHGHRAHLEQLANGLGIHVEFVGEVGKAEVNRYVNASKIGVICCRRDAVPRALLEYLAAGVPVVVRDDLLAGQRYVDSKSGIICAVEQFHQGLATALDHLEAFSPRTQFQKKFSCGQVMQTFTRLLAEAGFGR